MAEQLLAERHAPHALADRCRKIAMVITDMDGVLTDSGVYVGPEGELAKKFSTRDGMGFALLRKAGIEAAIMTSEASRFANARAAKLKVSRVLTGVKDKGEALEKLLKGDDLTADQVAFIGDDVNDLPILDKVGLAACPSNAVDTVKRRVHYICKAPGGGGCVRELIDLILARKY
jgi:YrbI family 3-deoxy-D-manno-octulosonate 8-phosphate phosphatase